MPTLTYCINPIANSVATTRLRALNLFKYLEGRGYTIKTCPGASWGTEVPRGDIVILQKHWYHDLKMLEKIEAPVVSDFSNDRFEHPEVGHIYHALLERADYVTTNGQEMGKRLEELGASPIVIPDPYEMPSLPVRPPRKPPVILWIGHDANFIELGHLCVPDGSPLLVCSNKEPMIGRYVEWSPMNALRAMATSDIVQIPMVEHKKSSNRIISALRAGRYVLAYPSAAHEEFRPYAYVGKDFEEAIEWAVGNPEIVSARIEAGQRYVRERYSPETIAGKWADLFDSILAAGAESSKAM